MNRVPDSQNNLVINRFSKSCLMKGTNYTYYFKLQNAAHSPLYFPSGYNGSPTSINTNN